MSLLSKGSFFILPMQKYANPYIILLVVGALYNMVDQIFIANAIYPGSFGNAANTMVFPLTVAALLSSTASISSSFSSERSRLDSGAVNNSNCEFFSLFFIKIVFLLYFQHLKTYFKILMFLFDTQPTPYGFYRL